MQWQLVKLEILSDHDAQKINFKFYIKLLKISFRRPSTERPVLVSGTNSFSQFSKTYRSLNHLGRLQKPIHVNRKIKN